jgi:hypothetical protein
MEFPDLCARLVALALARRKSRAGVDADEKETIAVS